MNVSEQEALGVLGRKPGLDQSSNTVERGRQTRLYVCTCV